VNADVNPTTITCHLQLQVPESLVPLDSLVHLVPLVAKVLPEILVPQVPLVHAVWSDLLVPLDLPDLLDQLVPLVEDLTEPQEPPDFQAKMVPQVFQEHLVRMDTTAPLELRENLEIQEHPVPLDSVASPEHEDLMELQEPLDWLVELDPLDPLV